MFFEVTISGFYFEARRFMRLGKYDQLAKALTEYKQRDQETAHAKKLQLAFEGVLSFHPRGDYERAFELLQDSLRVELNSQVDNCFINAFSHAFIGLCHAKLHQYEEMKQSCKEAKRYFAELELHVQKSGVKDVYMEANMKDLNLIVSHTAIGVYLALGKTKTALDAIEHAKALAVEMGDIYGIVRRFIDQAIALINYNNGVAKAERCLDSAERYLEVASSDLLTWYIKVVRKVVEIRKLGDSPYYEGQRISDYHPHEVEKIFKKVKQYVVEGELDSLFKRDHFWKKKPESAS